MGLSWWDFIIKTTCPGKSPLIIFADCDMEKAVKNGLGSVFFNKGENCIAAGRIFVEETIYDEFLERSVDYL